MIDCGRVLLVNANLDVSVVHIPNERLSAFCPGENGEPDVVVILGVPILLVSVKNADLEGDGLVSNPTRIRTFCAFPVDEMRPFRIQIVRTGW